ALDDVFTQAGCLLLALGLVEASTNREERESRDDVGRGVDVEQIHYRHEGGKGAGDDRPGDRGRLVARLDATVGGDQIVAGDKAWYGRELGGVKGDVRRRLEEAGDVDPDDREVAD